jgi:hypothetical protein
MVYSSSNLPAAIDFGQQTVGDPATQQIVLTNSSAGRLSILAVTAVAEAEGVREWTLC